MLRNLLEERIFNGIPGLDGVRMLEEQVCQCFRTDWNLPWRRGMGLTILWYLGSSERKIEQRPIRRRPF